MDADHLSANHRFLDLPTRSMFATISSRQDSNDGKTSTAFKLVVNYAGPMIFQQTQPRLIDLLRRADATVLLQDDVATRSRVDAGPIGAILCEFVSEAELESGSSTIRYLPLHASDHIDERAKSATLRPDPSMVAFIQSAPSPLQGSLQVDWPCNKIPMEIFEHISSYLSRDDFRSFRLVNREFETKLSGAYFRETVVSFSTELYNPTDNHQADPPLWSTALASACHDKGASHAFEAVPFRQLPDQHNTQVNHDGHYHTSYGLGVFQSFGKHINRFGMSLEVSEKELEEVPRTPRFDNLESYYGAYVWPPTRHLRYQAINDLEHTAEEHMRLKAAFSTLTNMRELALSIDNGLGWLNGPDRSWLNKAFPALEPIFRNVEQIACGEIRFLRSMKDSAKTFGCDIATRNDLELAYQPLYVSVNQLEGIGGTEFADTSKWPIVRLHHTTAMFSKSGTDPVSSRLGVFYLAAKHHCDECESALMLKPSTLRQEQREWLLQTGWAQQAFIGSYVLAVLDNPLIFAHVKHLNISKMSSSFLDQLKRRSFWDALPGMTDLTLIVKPDWRYVHRASSGKAEVSGIGPSTAVAKLTDLLILHVRSRPGLKRLTIGYSGGGENAQGIFSRNKHILPAPLCKLEHCLEMQARTIAFPLLEEITLVNCWMTPLALRDFVTTHRSLLLKRLCLDSFSLTALPVYKKHHALPLSSYVSLLPEINHKVKRRRAQLEQKRHGIPSQEQQAVYSTMSSAWPTHTASTPTSILSPAAVLSLGLPPHCSASAVKLNNASLHKSDNPHRYFYRRGSWPHLIAEICPGEHSEIFAQDSTISASDTTNATAPLDTLELRSVGYVAIRQADFHQDHLMPLNPSPPSPSAWQTALQMVMMHTNEGVFGDIVPHMPAEEFALLRVAWGLSTSPRSFDVLSKLNTSDGCPAKGTGRASGIITKLANPIEEAMA